MRVIKAVRVTECACTVQNSLEMQESFECLSSGEVAEEAFKFRGQTL